MSLVDYRFLGMSLGSERYNNELKKLGEEQSTTVKTYQGNYQELTEQGFDLGNETYQNEQFLIIQAGDKQPQILRTNESRSGTVYLLNRYAGYTEKGVQDPNELSSDLLYYLSITLGRFTSQNEAFYRESNPNVILGTRRRHDKDYYLGITREKFRKESLGEGGLPKDSYKLFKESSRLLRDINYLSSINEGELSQVDLFKKSSQPSEAKEVGNLSELLERVSRLQYLAIDSFILTERGKNEELPDNLKTKLEHNLSEISRINNSGVGLEISKDNQFISNMGKISDAYFKNLPDEIKSAPSTSNTKNQLDTLLQGEERLKKNYCLNVIRQSFFTKHFQEIHLTPDVFKQYKQITRLLRDVILMRIAPEYQSTVEEILEKANEPIIDLSDEITTPNYMIDRVIRLTVLAVDAIILDHQKSLQTSSDKENSPDFSDRILKISEESGALHIECITKTNFNTQNRTDRHKLPSSKHDKAFEYMVGEIAGDLMKATMACNKTDPKQKATFCNFQIMFSRVQKLTECIDDISRIDSKLPNLFEGKMLTEAQEFFYLTKKLISISQRDSEAMTEVDHEQSKVLFKLRKYTQRLHNHGNPSDKQKATMIDELLDYTADLSHSKRSNFRTDSILERMEQPSKEQNKAS